jgi:opacity protein-like surface antigen
MSKTFAAFAVSIALVSIGASLSPAIAGDMNNGGGSSKNHGGKAVAVPAPVPYEEHYKYYMGAGLGWAFRSSGDIVSTGAPDFGDASDFRGPGSISLFAGRYITPSLRIELGIDLRTEQKRARNNTLQATVIGRHDFGPPFGVLPVANVYDVSRTDEIQIRNNTFMINAYYDMNRGGRFNPYIGVGVGIAQMQLHRELRETIGDCTSRDPTNPDPTITFPCWATSGPSGSPTTGATRISGDSQTGYGLAASVMAGLTYNISSRTHLDVGYRLMFQGGKAAVLGDTLGSCGGCSRGTGTVEVESRIDHEIRTGLRWDLW